MAKARAYQLINGGHGGPPHQSCLRLKHIGELQAAHPEAHRQGMGVALHQFIAQIVIGLAFLPQTIHFQAQRPG